MRLRPEVVRDLEVDEKTLVVAKVSPKAQFMGHGPGAVCVEYTRKDGTSRKSVLPLDCFKR